MRPANTIRFQLFDERIRGLLQREHLNTLVTHQIDHSLRVGLPFEHVERHHPRIMVAGHRMRLTDRRHRIL